MEDGHCITGQSPGAAMAFALKLVELVCGEKVSQKVAQELVLPPAA